MKVFVTGATGAIGRNVVRILRARGDTVVALSRSKAKALARLGDGVTVVEGDPTIPGAWQESLKEVDGAITLAGEPVLRRWDDEGRRLIRESRIEGTQNVALAIASSGRKTVLVAGSATGFYGARGDEVLDESSPPGAGFLPEVCAAWEKASEPAHATGSRVVNARTGIVLDPKEGALAQMLTPFKLFVGGHTGSGAQWMSWIHRDDMARLLVFALDAPALSGVMNAVAPTPVTSRELAKALGRALSRPSFLPLPGFVLKLAFGEAAEIILTGSRIVPKKALDAGFVFEHPAIDEALRSLVAPVA